MNVTYRRMGLDEAVLPQAIIWRPIHYFSTYVRKEEDHFDKFLVSTFQLGNELTFDLRHYRGYPRFTVSLYFPSNLGIERLGTKIQRAISALNVPPKGVAWKRGEDFKYGQLDQPREDRLREPEARVLALKIAARRRDRTATIEYIKDEIERTFPFTDQDLKIAQRNEPVWRQIVGNVISHQSSPSSIFSKGFAERTNDGLRVTDNGVDYLNGIGFHVD